MTFTNLCLIDLPLAHVLRSAGEGPLVDSGDAEARGARTVTGKWMLIYQAAEQFELWTGKKAPVEAMAEAFDAAGSA